MRWGEFFLKKNYNDKSLKKDTILITSYLCHPSMANNELSGPAVAIGIAKWLQSLEERRYNYRIVFVPETIGALVYLNRFLDHLKEKVVAGFNLTCVGDDRSYSFLPSRLGSTLSDKCALHVLKYVEPSFKSYEWKHRGSDERQYCAPGADLPVASIMRTKWGEYPEYHTSLDQLGTVVTPQGLFGSFRVYQKVLRAIEINCKPHATNIGEPQLGKRGLYPNISTRVSSNWVPEILEFLTWCDGQHDLFDISDKIGKPIWKIEAIFDVLLKHDLISTGNN